MSEQPSTSRSSIPGAPIHPLAALVTVILDWLWTLIEGVQVLSIAMLPTILPTSIVVGLLGLTAVTLVQKFLAKDEWGPAFAKGFVMGIATGVPFPVTGSVLGVPLLLWAGVHEGQKLLAPPKG